MDPQKPLVVIVGPTASGKSELALKVAKSFNGEIICADSRTIYKGMDIGSAKPSRHDQNDIKHHLIDIVEPGQKFSAYTFQQQAKAIIENIRLCQKVPVMVGGTGLYIDSVIFDYRFPPVITLKKEVEALDTTELHSYCKKNKIPLPQNEHNRRHLITAILQKDNKPKKDETPLKNTLIVGITTEINRLEQRIAKRTEYIFSHGVVGEAKKLGEMYGWDNESMKANIYPIIQQFLKGKITIDEAKQKNTARDRQLAKRQLTWFKRNEYITWLTLDKAETFLFNSLAKANQK